MSINAVAEHFDISPSTVRRLIADGQIPATRIGGQIRVPVSALEKLGEPVNARLAKILR